MIGILYFIFDYYFLITKFIFYKNRSLKTSEPRSSRNLIYKPEDHPYGLLPAPPYCEKFFRQTVQDFQLPYDLWWQHNNNKLPGRDSVPSWKYRKIRTSEMFVII